VQAKLTLSIDPAVVIRAKRYSKKSGVSISQMVEAYLDSVTRPAPIDEKTPVLNALRGILKGADPDAYKKHLVKKYLG
jgi:hypothetical protein